jgi:hypothetical protein
MPRYARLDANRRIIDLYDAASTGVLEQRMGVNGWIEVAGDTVIHSHVAIDGTVTPSVPVAAPVLPKMLTANQVIDLILAEIGTAGFAACLDDATNSMKTWRKKLDVAKGITKDQAAQGLTIIVNVGLMTAQQRTNILNAWPAV